MSKRMKILEMLKTFIVRFTLFSFLLAGTLSVTSCGDDVILDEALRSTTEPVTEPEAETYFQSGDIIIVSGGTVARTASPYPLHTITQWSSTGAFIRTLASAVGTTTYFYAADLDANSTSLYYTIDTVDRIEKINISTLVATTHILDAALTGTTIRGVAVLSDGSVLAAESTTSIEKFDANLARVSVNFPIVVGATIQSIKRISGNRFVVITTGNSDYPRVYNNDGTLVTNLTGLTCTTNCDPSDIVELSDGRFVVSYQNATYQSLELFDSSFAHVGQLYKDTDILRNPGAMSLLANGNIIACSTLYNVCEEISVSGSTGTRVGTSALIGDPSLMRQPTSVLVIP